MGIISKVTNYMKSWDGIVRPGAANLHFDNDEK